MKFETRSLQELEASEGKLVGYAARFNVRSADMGFYEIIKPGAFARALANPPTEGIYAYVEHDPARIIGRTTAGTLTLTEDDRGLRVEITPPDTSVGRDLTELVRSGHLDAMSFAFRVRPEDEDIDYSGDKPLRIIRSFDVLKEVSVVSHPAYPDTSIALRSIEDHRPRIVLDLLRMKLDLLERN